MEDYIGQICPLCGKEIKEGEPVKVCPDCGAAHHESCWEENHGCASATCSAKQNQETSENQANVCKNCGAPLNEGQKFCTNCGASQEAPKKNVCSKCGAELTEGQRFCPMCGQKIDAGAGESAAANSSAQKAHGKKKALPVLIGAAAVIIIVIVVVLVAGGKKKGFKEMYSDISGEVWCTIASDNSYMKIDTNPDDTDDEDRVWSDYETCVFPASEAIERINKELGFSDALMEKMNTTTWSQGRQTESNDRYTVTWTYHPDKGLEVMYEFKK